MLLENMSMACFAIKANKMRSFLTMLGIIIGISSVIAIVSIGDSMRAMLAGMYDNIGITRAYISVSWRVDDFRMSDYFTLEEMDRLKEVFAEEITYADPSSSARGDAVFGRNKERYMFQGIDYNYTVVQKINIVAGRNLSEADVKNAKRNVVLEEKGAKKLFGTDDPVGKTFRMTIDGNLLEYMVVGVYRKDETPLEAMLGGNGSTQSAFAPYTTMVSSGSIFNQIHVSINPEIDFLTAIANIKQYVANTKGRVPTEIDIYSAKDEMGGMDTMLGGVSAAVGGIAAISLLVGGIGIMNIMLVSVTERTREIGIRKALGARTKDVLVQFLTESAILSALGGIMGVILGVGFVSLGGALLGMSVVIKPTVIILAVSFSALVGVFFGLYPASKAAKKDPIEALRFE